MTKVNKNGQLEWILEATTEELELRLGILRAHHRLLLKEHESLIHPKEHAAALKVLDQSYDTLILITQISKELVNRELASIWEDNKNA
jgi:hypothetical protein